LLFKVCLRLYRICIKKIFKPKHPYYPLLEKMRPLGLPRNLWVADLSLMPRSQGLPTMLTAAALALRVSKRIVEEKQT
jgi:hypothetical protein